MSEQVYDQEEQPETFYLTFGVQYAKTPHPNYERADPDGVIALTGKTYSQARAWAFQRFGRYWSDLMSAEHWRDSEQYFPAGVIETIEVPGTKVYQHPQGKQITVWDDGLMLCVGPDGKKKPTSATPDQLAGGYGSWEQVA